MPAGDFIAFALATVVSFALTRRVRQHALAQGMLDIPGSRSSHLRPTPRGGGLAIAITLVLGIFVLWLYGDVGIAVTVACGLGGCVVAAIGYLDDQRSLSALPRFCVHLVAATVSVLVLLQVPLAQPFFSELPRSFAFVLLVLGAVWSINLFNFMDGIDGIAASQAIFVSGASTVLVVGTDGYTAWSTLCAATAGGSLGFLLWNWPPAKIFMGDVGSGFLGFWLALLAIGLHVSGALNIWTSVILNSVFVADATSTLFRRIIRGERWYEAHRSHAYQLLARKWRSHLRVTGLVIFIDFAVVLPLAYASLVREEVGAWIAFALVISLALGCLALGAGKTSADGELNATN